MAEELPELSASELNERLRRGDALTLLDVRDPREWELGNLAAHGAVLRPLEDYYDWREELDRDAEIVVYCRSGARSGVIARDLISSGFERVWNLKGGILAWARDVDPSIPSY